jgi:hypothetical protein
VGGILARVDKRDSHLKLAALRSRLEYERARVARERREDMTVVIIGILAVTCILLTIFGWGY